MTKCIQINDDLDLLELMNQDSAAAPDIFKPTNWWDVYGKKLDSELRCLGLHNFRCRRNSLLTSMGATDLSLWGKGPFSNCRLLNNRYTAKIKGWQRLLLFFDLPFVVPELYKSINQLAWHVTNIYGIVSNAKPLTSLNASIAGNPEDIFWVGEQVYTGPLVAYFMLYTYCCRFIDFSSVNLIAEIGPGCGKQVEVIKKLHPHISFLLFDIPPVLYVCEQYLKSIFPEVVVPYRETRLMHKLPSLSEGKKGKIYIFGNWATPMLQDFPIDLFWNANSFQEMEPTIVAEYLNIVNSSATHVFLLEMMAGQRLADRAGVPGVLEKTHMEHYLSGLPDFDLLDICPSPTPTVGRPGYSNSFWKRIRSIIFMGPLGRLGHEGASVFMLPSN